MLLVRRIVGRKLGGHGSNTFRSDDIEDVTADAVLVLVKRLQRVRDDPAADDIERLDDYTAAVAYSACAHHLRRRYPERSRLPHRLRYLLGHDRLFGLWALGSVVCCGCSRGTGRRAVTRSTASLRSNVSRSLAPSWLRRRAPTQSRQMRTKSSNDRWPWPLQLPVVALNRSIAMSRYKRLPIERIAAPGRAE